MATVFGFVAAYEFGDSFAGFKHLCNKDKAKDFAEFLLIYFSVAADFCLISWQVFFCFDSAYEFAVS